jgi:hypothetical protein
MAAGDPTWTAVSFPTPFTYLKEDPMKTGGQASTAESNSEQPSNRLKDAQPINYFNRWHMQTYTAGKL